MGFDSLKMLFPSLSTLEDGQHVCIYITPTAFLTFTDEGSIICLTELL